MPLNGCCQSTPSRGTTDEMNAFAKPIADQAILKEDWIALGVYYPNSCGHTLIDRITSLVKKSSTAELIMRFGISSLLFLIAYVAIVVTSLQWPHTFWLEAARLTSIYSCAAAFVIGFDRRSTPCVSFGVFAIFSLIIGGLPDWLVSFVQNTMKSPKGSNEYNVVREILPYHFMMVSGIIGFQFGLLIRRKDSDGHLHGRK